MPALASFDYAVVRIVPRVERGEFLNAGVILFCRTRRFLAATIEFDRERLRCFAPLLDIEETERHLAVIPRVCSGDPGTGEIGGLPQAGRWHWLVAPRSTIIQPSPVHSGLCLDPGATLDHLVHMMVATTG